MQQFRDSWVNKRLAIKQNNYVTFKHKEVDNIFQILYKQSLNFLSLNSKENHLQNSI